MAADPSLQTFEAALAHERAGRRPQAELLYRQIIAKSPDHGPALYRLGLLAQAAGQLDEARKLMGRAAELRPREAKILGDYGVVLADAGRTHEAIAAYRAALKEASPTTALHNNLGNALVDAGQLEEAIASFQRAAELAPALAQIQNNLATALQEAGRFDQALAAFRRALALQPNFPYAVWNFALLLLLNGDFANGWAAYEARWQVDRVTMHREFRQPLWDGSDLRGRRILLHAEQGFGDAIQFIRFAPLIKSRGGRVMVLCPPPLRRLFATVPGIDELYTDGDPLPPFDVHCPLMSLPRLLGTTVQRIPADIPYIHADSGLAQQWRARMALEPAALKVGVAWSGRQGDVANRKRFMPAEALTPLMQIPGARFYSLQKELPSGQSPPAGMVDWTADLHDFADTAAFISTLDVVLSVDTVVAHVAGAMGKMTGVILPHVSDWRWLRDRQDSPWYPTARLFRQPNRGDWASPIEQIRAGLQRLVASPPTRSTIRSATEQANLGLGYAARGRYLQAIEAFRAAIALQPQNARLHNDLGISLKNSGQLIEALMALRQAARLAPHDAEIHHNLGQALYEQMQFIEAAAILQNAAAIRPDDPQIHHNLGKTLNAAGRLEEAATCFERAIAHQPGFAKAYTCLGIVRREQGNDPAAIAAFRAAAEKDPGDPDPQRLLGLLLLARGQFTEGFPLYEVHRHMPQFRDIHDFPQPMWNGESLKGRTLLIYADGGFGDTIHMARYVPLIERGTRVIFECQQPLKRLLEHSLPGAQIVARGEPLPHFDVYCPTVSVPRVLKTTVETIPGGVPYLAADATEVDRWKKRIGFGGEVLNVGLVWSGRPDPPGRSVPFETLAPLGQLPGIQFHSIAPPDSQPPGNLRIVDWSAELTDFANTAALFNALDLIVSIDTAAAHLAGALGRPLWLLLAHPADWRWLRDRADTPWYPTARLFRQREKGNWVSLVADVASEIGIFARSAPKNLNC